MYIPDAILAHLPKGTYTVEEIGCSGAQVQMFENCVLKIEPDSNMSANERQMMQWLKGKMAVPDIIASAQVDGMRYLLMSRLKGAHLCADDILDDQVRLADIVAEGLRRMWSVDIHDCPADRRLNQKLQEIDTSLSNNTLVVDQAAFADSGFSSPRDLFDWLVKHRPQEDLTFSHGDYCLPNIFAYRGSFNGVLDLGYAGIADKWVDIEKVLWSMWANTTGIFGGPKRHFDRKYLFSALDMQPDEDKLHYYGLLEIMT